MKSIIELAEKYHKLQERKGDISSKEEKEKLIQQAVDLTLSLYDKSNNPIDRIALWSGWSALEKIREAGRYIFNQTFSTTKDAFDDWEQKFIEEPKKKFSLQDKDEIIKKLQEISKKYAGKNPSTMSRQQQLEMSYDISQCFSKEKTLTFADYKKAIDYGTFYSLVFISAAKKFSTEVDVFYPKAGLRPNSIVWSAEVAELDKTNTIKWFSGDEQSLMPQFSALSFKGENEKIQKMLQWTRYPITPFFAGQEKNLQEMIDSLIKYKAFDVKKYVDKFKSLSKTFQKRISQEKEPESKTPSATILGAFHSICSNIYDYCCCGPRSK